MIDLRIGDTLRFTCEFEHRGEAFTGAKLHAAIGTKNPVYFDEILNKEKTITGIGDDASWQSYTATVDVPITSDISGGTYEAYVKLMAIPGPDIFWDGPLQDIAIVADAEFKNLSVAYQKV